ncbi:uncharacterized protein A4U43_C07F18250 [Asparagus officinalis]|uniref:Uncharacterized protein n=1 Tax=Asparagus officinalis TaxID=4686 RepID=A0A5P1ED80_ASPOF|nr:uncharacterized protein LOC109848706 [Asparagus officinalis]ONK63723.1 uncharacterized protein A4U43_C07F18250 [Asparagus officinalis]
MGKRSVNYAVIDAFTDAPFKGNPAAVCFLEKHDYGYDDEWMQSVAKEFNISETAFLTPAPHHFSSHEDDGEDADSNPRFNLRWFTPVAEVKLCGHGTIAAAHFIFTSGTVKGDVIEFVTKSGILTAKKICRLKHSGDDAQDGFSIELDFPVITFGECEPKEIPSIPTTLNGLSMISVQKTSTAGDLIVELSSGEDVVNIQPNFDEIQKCAGMGLIITAPAPPGSGFDFFSRFFCPKLGINEDPVCGSAHCALAPYWSKKLGKHSLIAFMASPRGGRLELELVEEAQRVHIKGKAVTVMVGTLLA